MPLQVVSWILRGVYIDGSEFIMNGTHPAGKGGLSAGRCGTGERRGPRTEEGAGRAQGHFPGRPEEDPDLIGW